jgi:hydroxymethylpyrimidine/phosphomethylpyrimidine kinase
LPEENFGSFMPSDFVIPGDPQQPEPTACVLTFNASDPCGAGGQAADIVAVACVGAHALSVVTGAYARDTAHIFDFYPLDDEAVAEQARAVLEDIELQAIKLGFAGTPDNLGVVAGISADYPDVPLIAFMPDLSWWSTDEIDNYHEAFVDLILPQTAVLIGSYSTLRRWLLPHWTNNRPPGARDLAIAAGELGASYTLVTGIDLGERGIDNMLASPQSLLVSARFDRLDGQYIGTGDTLSATFSALLANGYTLTDAFTEALGFLDGSLKGGFRPGMGHTLPNRLFWAQPPSKPDDTSGTSDSSNPDSLVTSSSDIHPHDTQH